MLIEFARRIGLRARFFNWTFKIRSNLYLSLTARSILMILLFIWGILLRRVWCRIKMYFLVKLFLSQSTFFAFFGPIIKTRPYATDFRRYGGTAFDLESNFALRREKISAPVFQGDLTEKPIKFLQEMRRYRQPNKASIEDMKYVLSRSLKGHAVSWWYGVQSSIRDYEEFEELFKDKFWSEVPTANT